MSAIKYFMKGVCFMEHNATTIVFGCGKGGVAKTTSCVIMAHLLGKRGHKVLMIDADHQGNASKGYGFFEDTTSDKSLFNYLIDFCRNPKRDTRPNASNYIRNTSYKNIDIITGDPRLQNDELEAAITSLEIKMKIDPLNILISQIKELDKYDYVLIDSRPDMGIVVTSIFQASDWVLVPTTISDNALDGATNTVYFVEDLMDAGCRVKLAGVFFTMVDTRTELFKVNIPSAKENRFKDGDVLDTIIVQAEQIRKAENLMKPASDVYPTCAAVKKYDKLLDEVVNKIGK